MTWIVSGPSGTVYGTTGREFLVESDGGSLHARWTPRRLGCALAYTTPELGLGSHRFASGRASRGIGPEDSRTWTIATRPRPPPCRPPRRPPRRPASEPTPVPTVTSTRSPSRRSRRPSSVLAAGPLNPIDVSIVYFMNAKKRYTRFATLSVRKVPAGATVTVTCRGGCPRKSQTLTSAKGGTVKLGAWLRSA